MRPLGERLREARTTALIKAEQLEVVRIVLPTGKSLREHSVPGEITVQCLEGRVQFHTTEAVLVLERGDFIHLLPHTPHALHALDDASLLLTIRLQP